MWGPLVFVNLDLDAPPLAEYLEGVPDDTAWADLDEFRCQVTATTVVDCNWKVVADGFSETYHVQGIHAELLGSIDDVNARTLWGLQAVSYQDYGVPSPGSAVTSPTRWCGTRSCRRRATGWVLWPPSRGRLPPCRPACRCVTPSPAASGPTRPGTAPTSRGSTPTGSCGLSQYNLFPNVTVLLWADMFNLLIARPGPTPGQAELVAYLLHRAPSPMRRARSPAT